MRITGLEPARVASLEPKSSASANFAISANKKSAIFHIKSPIKINFNVKLPIK